MARNQEKAQSMLYRFREAMLMEAGKLAPKERPNHTNDTFRIDHCRHFRREVVREIGDKVVKIQDRKTLIETINLAFLDSCFG